MIFWQILFLLLVCAGWGYWAHRLIPFAFAGRFGWLFSGFTGFALAVLVPNNLVYFGVTLAYSAWFVLAVALGGIGTALIGRLRSKERPDPVRCREVLVVLGLSISVMLIQGAGLLSHGPHDYYGNGHTDQVNYTILAQFLMDQPYSRELDSIGLHPWMIKAFDLKRFRLGQSVCTGIVSVVSNTDAKAGYGSTSVFYLGLLASAVYAFLRTLALGRWLSVIGALWSCLLPSLTKLQLDGFLSHIAVLFVFPALAALLIRARKPTIGIAVIAGIWSGYTFGSYTEMYPISIAFSVVLMLASPATSIARRVLLAATSAVLSALCLLPYLGFATWYMKRQYSVAGNPEVLASLFPNSGTLTGWGETFASPPHFTFAANIDMAALIGCAMLLLIAGAFLSSSFLRRLQMLVVVCVPAGLSILLLSRIPFSKYPFGKLVVSFGWLWCALALLGMLRLLSPWIGRRSRIAAGAGTLMLLLLSLFGTAVQLRSVVKNEGILAAINSTAARSAYRFAETHPDRTYIVREEHNILCAWIAYSARNASVYIDGSAISDHYIPSDLSIFPRPPPGVRLVQLNAAGIKDLANYTGPPELLVRNGQGIDSDSGLVWYWIGDWAEFDITRYTSPPEIAPYQVDMIAMPGPANPSLERTVALLADDGRTPTKITFSGIQHVSFPITLKKGLNRFRFAVVAPTEQLVVTPGDKRKLMVRIQQIDLRPVAAGDSP